MSRTVLEMTLPLVEGELTIIPRASLCPSLAALQMRSREMVPTFLSLSSVLEVLR